MNIRQTPAFKRDLKRYKKKHYDITKVKVGVAMGNGGEEIKAMADFITDAVEDDGLAHAFEKLGLI